MRFANGEFMSSIKRFTRFMQIYSGASCLHNLIRWSGSESLFDLTIAVSMGVFAVLLQWLYLSTKYDSRRSILVLQIILGILFAGVAVFHEPIDQPAGLVALVLAFALFMKSRSVRRKMRLRPGYYLVEEWFESFYSLESGAQSSFSHWNERVRATFRREANKTLKVKEILPTGIDSILVTRR